MNIRYLSACILVASTIATGCQASEDEGVTLTAHAAPAAIEESVGARLAEFSTEFKNATESRAHNIKMASKAIDEYVVKPGKTFSFNNTVGPTTKQRGYMLGKIFINGKDAKGYGGGVCQVSSTLFNAVQQAGLEVTERHEHSKPVGYVKEGQDATTSYGGKDFKFTNNKPYAIRINSETTEDSINITLEAV